MFTAVRRQALRRITNTKHCSLSTSLSTASLRLLTSPETIAIRHRTQWPALSARLFSYSSTSRAEAALAQEPEEAIPEPPKTAPADHTSPKASQDVPLKTFMDVANHELVDKKIMKPILEDLKFEQMTEVQANTLHVTLRGTDIVSQAKTGTGKTIAFLLPVLQRLLNSPKPLALYSPRKRLPVDIRSLIITPTRELAVQVARDCEKLIKYIPHFRVQIAVGGASKRGNLRALHSLGCNILVATPGRLYDLLSDPDSGVAVPNLETLVLDEADNLLDSGFAQELKTIMTVLPPKDTRQTLLFSATVPEKVQRMIEYSLRPGYKVLKFVDPNEVPTHQKVPQYLIRVKGLENCLPTLHELMLREMGKFPAGGETPFKGIVFFPTARNAAFAAAVFNNIGTNGDSSRSPFYPARIIEIHSRLNQNQRDNASEKFRKCPFGALFSSDVTARGMDFPGVTHVIQVGMPASVEQYIHRVGRTGRGGKAGVGYTILADIEHDPAMRELGKKIKLAPSTDLTIPDLDMEVQNKVPEETANILTRTIEAARRTEFKIKAHTYRANLGYYSSSIKNKAAFVQALNRCTKIGWGMDKPPSVSAQLISKMGLKGLDIIVSRIGDGEGFSTYTGRRNFEDGDSKGTGRFPDSRDNGEGSPNHREGQSSERSPWKPIGGRAGLNGNWRPPREGGEERQPPFDRSQDKEQRPFAPRGDRDQGGEVRSFTARPGRDQDRIERPFTPRFDRGEGKEDKTFTPRPGGRPFTPRFDRPEGGEGKSFPPRPGQGESGGGRSFMFRPGSGEQRPFAAKFGQAENGGEKSFTPRSDRGEGKEEKPFGLKPDRDESRGERPFTPRFGRDEDRERRPFIPRSDRGEDRERRPFIPRSDRGEGREGRPFIPRSDRGEGREGRPFFPRSDRGEGREGRPFFPRSDRGEGREERSFTPRFGGGQGREGRRPFAPKNQPSWMQRGNLGGKRPPRSK